MQLHEAIAAAGMMPPKHITPGRFVRFPGAGKGRSNTAGWCKVITPTLAIFGDWSTGLSEIWKDDAHRDDAESKRLEREAREEAKRRAQADAKRAREVERQAQRMLTEAKYEAHPYLASKGFKHTLGLTWNGKLLVPIRAVEDYSRILSMQLIAADGEKRFLTGGRVKGGIHALGPDRAPRVALCEGLATGLTVKKALENLPGPWRVIVCFSAGNLISVAEYFPQAIVCADRDESGTGEAAARKTGLRWAMPPEVGDFNDMYQRKKLVVHVTEVLRSIA